ncbi:MAG TPA: hypothetical protein VFZ61_34370 [Polyangiales bacterium]
MLTPLLALGARRTYRTRLLWLALPCVLAACAEGIGFPEDEFMQADGAVMVDSSRPKPDGALATPDTGSVTPTNDAGSVGPTEDVSSPPVDTGTPAAEDTGTTPTEDAGTTPPTDAGSDTGPQTPMDASRPDATTPVMDAAPEAGPPDAMPPMPEASTNPNQCANTPSYATTTACAKCTCMKCPQRVETCYESNEASKNSQCIMVQACAEQNKCVQEGCYCGESSCLSPSGPCRALIEQVAGGGPLSVQRAEADAQHALGRASLIGACQLENCRTECGLN